MPEADYAGLLSRVAGDIEALRADFPQLADFSAAANLDAGRLTISYAFRTHPPAHRGGWTAGVPAPDDRVLWFHLDFHDEDSTAQIHTQPVAPRSTLGGKIVWLLILEGARTRPVAGRIREILERHGATG